MNDWMNEVTYDMLPPKQKEIADIIGIIPTLKLCEVYGGSRDVYIPKNDDVRRQLRDRQIRADYVKGGYKVAHLQKLYNLSDRSVQKIIKEVRPGQIGLDEIL